ncbi:MAG: Fe-S cluster assembly protein SufD [Paenibacillus macerans]|uniref:Fe-S cluster assembly protein SufD n=2 Tax=Paenibacillus macerans TaxID=44252 RepID=A0A6N8EZQ6_PAEMA|nr:Fe-S cluster assembly protein SufD [Paenibacillus macerans]MBS5913416.1 Fe-S cluster assembly protein SufD [Paenibacillus macerans]MDU7476174.1 Fe-S cluster assembly protein SufD [Paenibacillus macerans]MEC0141249.1 Fe-S cluster assembly protein SufD [Paenibacillus macerans]MEC0332874.1 Fe-S cluster assembly protein SufD [Paenibacillus macerans]MUG24233.1 Fe-S cluster assembly protein SufD [Paenibacillus macerans]
MTTQTVLPVEAEQLKKISAKRGEPAWLTENRSRALQLAAELELPKLEKTRLDRWDLNNYGGLSEVRQEKTQQLPESITSLVDLTEHSNLLVQRNSDTVFTRLAPELAAKGVIFTDLETAAREHGDLVQKYLHAAVKPEENQLTALHAALWNGGVFLYVPKNVEIEAPLQSIFLLDEAEAVFAPHVLIVAEANSKVTYADNYISVNLGGKIVHNGSAEVFVNQGAKVQFATVHHLGEHATDLTFRRAIVENDGSIEWIVGEMNGGDAASETLSILKGNGSSSDVKAIAVGSGSQRLNYTTKAVHYGKSSSSQMITRAVMRESATAIINGITKIEKGATKADGQQTEKVLMLSPKARGDANPILLIDEDDVTAGHAASVGQVNPEQIYYLMSRGISRAEAERLIIYGFLAPVVSDIPLEPLQKQLQALVERKLGQ